MLELILWLIAALLATVACAAAVRLFLAIVVAGPRATEAQLTDIFMDGPLRRLLF